jgi:hypothetical protein
MSVMDEVITSLPGSIPRAPRAMWTAAVPEEQPLAYGRPYKALIFASIS